MTKLFLLLMLLALLFACGCETTPSGNREYIPGKGWVPTD